MKKKILIQRISASDPMSLANKAFETMVTKNCNMVKENKTEITLRLLKKGLDKLNEFAYSYLHYLNDREVFEAVLQGERDGFDAIIVYCFSDPALDEMKQALQIPVIGLGQSSMMLASLMGSKFGLISVSQASVARNEQLVRKYGFIEKVVLPIRPLALSSEEQGKMILDATVGIEAIKEIAREYISQGAEVLVPACGMLSLALRFCPGCPRLSEGLSEIDGVPVVDSVAAAIKMAEMMIDLKRAGSPWISRKGIYLRPSEQVINEAIHKIGYSFRGVISKATE